METKKVNILSYSLLAVMLAGHIFNIPAMVLLSVVIICGSILVCKSFVSTGLLFFFFPFSYIFAYGQYNLCIFMAVAYILHSVSKGRIYVKAFYTLLLLAYCFFFANYNIGNIKLGILVSPILISLLIFVCEETKPSYYLSMINYFKDGFIISAVVGFFKDQIPSIGRLFESNLLNDSGMAEYAYIPRYSGLAYDPNFFTVVICIVIAFLLFTTERFTAKTLLQLLFLVATGFMTFSKSYLLLIFVIFAVYILKRSHYVGRNLAILISAVVVFVLIENIAEINLISVTLGRLETSADSGDLTTGRWDLWKEYFIYIISNPHTLLWGEGFNALPLKVKAVHNTYLEFVYKFGSVGSLLWLIFFSMSYSAVSKKQDEISELATRLPFLVCLIGFMFLSAFTFQQFWCCFCLSYFIMFIPKEEKCLS